MYERSLDTYINNSHIFFYIYAYIILILMITSLLLLSFFSDCLMFLLKVNLAHFLCNISSFVLYHTWWFTIYIRGSCVPSSSWSEGLSATNFWISRTRKDHPQAAVQELPVFWHIQSAKWCRALQLIYFSNTSGRFLIKHFFTYPSFWLLILEARNFL